jgi:uncharacterized protein with von Willebrand factor type A (vWA) domain
MEIEAKKIKLVQDILKLEDEALLTELEQLLKHKRFISHKDYFVPMSFEDLEGRFDKAVSDVDSGRYKRSEELLKK